MAPTEYLFYGQGDVHNLTIKPLSATTSVKEYKVQDMLGSTRMAIKPDGMGGGAIVSQCDYEPFGNVLWQSGAPTRLGFIDKEEDKESALGDFGVRKYDDGIGRFTSIDPLWELYRSLTPYQYSANNPLVSKDPSGAYIVPPTHTPKEGGDLRTGGAEVPAEQPTRKLVSTKNSLYGKENTFSDGSVDTHEAITSVGLKADLEFVKIDLGSINNKDEHSMGIQVGVLGADRVTTKITYGMDPLGPVREQTQTDVFYGALGVFKGGYMTETKITESLLSGHRDTTSEEYTFVSAEASLGLALSMGVSTQTKWKVQQVPYDGFVGVPLSATVSALGRNYDYSKLKTTK